MLSIKTNVIKTMLGVVDIIEGRLFVTKHILLAPVKLIVREPVIGLIKWLRPKGLKVWSYVEQCAEFKNLTL